MSLAPRFSVVNLHWEENKWGGEIGDLHVGAPTVSHSQHGAPAGVARPTGLWRSIRHWASECPGPWWMVPSPYSSWVSLLSNTSSVLSCSDSHNHCGHMVPEVCGSYSLPLDSLHFPVLRKAVAEPTAANSGKGSGWWGSRWIWAHVKSFLAVQFIDYRDLAIKIYDTRYIWISDKWHI